jgi:hypothetical protein
MPALSLLMMAQQLHCIGQLCLKCAADEEVGYGLQENDFRISSKLEHILQVRVFRKTENCVTFIRMSNNKCRTTATIRELVFSAEAPERMQVLERNFAT